MPDVIDRAGFLRPGWTTRMPRWPAFSAMPRRGNAATSRKRAERGCWPPPRFGFRCFSFMLTSCRPARRIARAVTHLDTKARHGNRALSYSWRCHKARIRCLYIGSDDRTTAKRHIYVGKTGDNRAGCNPVISRAGNHFSFNPLHSQMRNISPKDPTEYDFDYFTTIFGCYVACRAGRRRNRCRQRDGYVN